jgi:hypothetical protein
MLTHKFLGTKQNFGVCIKIKFHAPKELFYNAFWCIRHTMILLFTKHYKHVFHICLIFFKQFFGIYCYPGARASGNIRWVLSYLLILEKVRYVTWSILTIDAAEISKHGNLVDIKTPRIIFLMDYKIESAFF